MRHEGPLYWHEKIKKGEGKVVSGNQLIISMQYMILGSAIAFKIPLTTSYLFALQFTIEQSLLHQYIVPKIPFDFALPVPTSSNNFSK